MAFISEYQHRVFLEVLNRSIKQFEEQHLKDQASRSILKNLKKEKDLLQDFYMKCNSKTAQLKTLITDYQLLQRKAQSELRVYRHRYIKK